MSCRVSSSRNAHQANLAKINARWRAKYSPDLGSRSAAVGRDPDVERLRADGDADVEPGAYLGDFVVPACVRCGGILKVGDFHSSLDEKQARNNVEAYDSSNMLQRH